MPEVKIGVISSSGLHKIEDKESALRKETGNVGKAGDGL